MRISDFSINHPVTVTILLVALTVFGLISVSTLRQEMFSDVAMPEVVIIAEYPGVGPLDVEREVTDTIEGEISTIPGLSNVGSTSMESLSMIRLEFEWGTDTEERLPEIREKINNVTDDLPEGLAGPPMLLQIRSDTLPIISIAVKSELDREFVTDFVDRQVIPSLSRIEGVAQVILHGGSYRIVDIKVDMDLLETENLSILDIFELIKYSNISFPAGSVVFKGKELNVRTYGEFSSLDEIRNLVIGACNDTFIRLKDVAEVTFGAEKADAYTISRGDFILVLDIRKQQDEDTIKIVREAKRRLKEIENERLGLIKFSILADQSRDINVAISSVRNSAVYGGCLAVLFLLLFLRNFRTTLIIAISIPFSLLLTFIALTLRGQSINLMTLGGLTVGIGMIVDSSIVVLENVHRIFSRTKNRKQAASEGTSEVGPAIIASTTTSLSVFIPMLFVQGFAGTVLRDVAYTIVYSLSASLLVSIVVVPFLYSLIMKEDPRDRKKGIFNSFSNSVERSIFGVEERYGRLLRAALDNRLFVFTLALVVLAISALSFDFLGFDFVAETDMDEIELDIETPAGYTLDRTRVKIAEMEVLIRRLVPEIEEAVFYVGMTDTFGYNKTSHMGFGRIRLKEQKHRKRSVFEIIDQLRVAIPEAIPDVDISIVNGGLGATAALATGGQGFRIEVFGNNLDQIYGTAEMIADIMAQDPNITRTELNMSFNRQEMVADLLRDYMGNLGITPYEAAVASRIVFHGMEAGKYRTDEGNYDIFLNSTVAGETITEDLLNRITLKSRSGQFIAFANFTDLGLNPTVSVINHQNKQKSVVVTGYMKRADYRHTSGRIISRVEELSLPIGVDWEITGSAKEMQTSFESLFYALLVAIFLVYMVMVIQFERFSQPLIVMLAVPFTLIGVVIGLLVFGSNLSIISFLGVIALAGIVVNNAIVMIDYINLLRNKYGRELLDAVIEGGRSRLKPILMTTLTTVLGVSPMALGIGEGAEVYAPLGQVIGGGLLTSTLVSLFLIPSIYYTLEKRKSLKKNKHEENSNVQSVSGGAEAT